MYIRNFQQDPSDLARDPKVYYHSRSGKAAFSQITDQLREGRGILCVTGEAGVGKSFLLQEITSELATEVTFINRPSRGQDFQSLMTGLCEDLGVETGKEDVFVALQLIDKFLEKQKQTNPRIALIIDDAHQLEAGVLDKLLLLSVPPSEDNSSLQVVLSGLPELETMIDQHKLPHEQFVVFRHRLDRLEPSEVGAFINYHIDTGCDGHEDLFTPAAISAIADYSNGIPRLIKKICGSALSAINAEDSRGVSEDLVDRVAEDYLLASKKTANETIPVRLDQRNSIASKNASFASIEEPVSLAQSDVRENVDGTKNRQPPPRVSLQKAETGVDIQSDPPSGEATEKTNTDHGENGSRPIVNNKSARRLAWGIAVLIILGATIFAYQANFSPTVESLLPVANLEEEYADQTALFVDDSEEIGQTSPTFDKHPLQTSEHSPEPDQQSTGTVIAGTDNPGSAARAFIADLENSGQPVKLNTIHDHAELLSKQNQLVDAYLLYFYAAKRGHGNAAFRLAQMTDPETFPDAEGVFEKASVMQANKWYLKAAQAGHPKAEHYLKQLRARVITKAVVGDEDAQRLVMQFQK